MPPDISPALQNRAADAVPITVEAMQDSETILAFLRPYLPDLTAGIAHLTRPRATTTPMATTPASSLADWASSRRRPDEPQFTARTPATFADFGAFGGHELQLFRRCPGAAAPVLVGSNPFARLAGRRLPGPAERCSRQPERLQLGPGGARTMRRIALIVAGVLVAALLIALPAIGSDGTSGDYKVRGIFDNGSFVVKGEQVRVAGANVGTVESGRRDSATTRSRATRAGRTRFPARPWWSWRSTTPASRTSAPTPAA